MRVYQISFCEGQHAQVGGDKARPAALEPLAGPAEHFAVSVTSVYNKLNGVETEVSRQMVRQTAQRMAEVVRSLSPRHAPLVRGYRTKIIDGNHLATTEHRIEELRTIGSGPLPGLALVILEPDRMLVSDVFPCEDGHGGGAWRSGEARDDFWLLSGGGTRRCVSRDDDCRWARGMDTPFRIVDAC